MAKQVLIHIIDIKYLILNKIVCKFHKEISSASSIFLDNQLPGNIFFGVYGKILAYRNCSNKKYRIVKHYN